MHVPHIVTGREAAFLSFSMKLPPFPAILHVSLFPHPDFFVCFFFAPLNRFECACVSVDLHSN